MTNYLDYGNADEEDLRPRRGRARFYVKLIVEMLESRCVPAGLVPAGLVGESLGLSGDTYDSIIYDDTIGTDVATEYDGTEGDYAVDSPSFSEDYVVEPDILVPDGASDNSDFSDDVSAVPEEISIIYDGSGEDITLDDGDIVPNEPIPGTDDVVYFLPIAFHKGDFDTGESAGNTGFESRREILALDGGEVVALDDLSAIPGDDSNLFDATDQSDFELEASSFANITASAGNGEDFGEFNQLFANMFGLGFTFLAGNASNYFNTGTVFGDDSFGLARPWGRFWRG